MFLRFVFPPQLCPPPRDVSYFLSLFLHNFAYYSGQNVTVSLTCFFPQTFLTFFCWKSLVELQICHTYLITRFVLNISLICSVINYFQYVKSIPDEENKKERRKKRIQSLFFLLIAQEAEKAAN